MQTSNYCLTDRDAAIIHRDVPAGEDKEFLLYQDMKKTFQQQSVLQAATGENDLPDAGLGRESPDGCKYTADQSKMKAECDSSLRLSAANIIIES